MRAIIPFSTVCVTGLIASVNAIKTETDQDMWWMVDVPST